MTSCHHQRNLSDILSALNFTEIILDTNPTLYISEEPIVHDLYYIVLYLLSYLTFKLPFGAEVVKAFPQKMAISREKKQHPVVSVYSCSSLFC